MAESFVVNFKTNTLHTDPPGCGIEIDDAVIVRRGKKQLDAEDAYQDLSKCKKCFG